MRKRHASQYANFGSLPVLFPFLGNPLGMFNKQTAKDKLEEKQENNNCLSDFKQPVMGIVQPRDDADP